MKMIEKVDTEGKDNKLFGLAALSQSVPPFVWGYILLFISIITLGLVWLCWSLLSLILTVIGIVLSLLVATCIIRYYAKIGFSSLKGLHEATMMSIDRQRANEKLNKERELTSRERETTQKARLTNLILETKVEMLKLKPDMMKYGISQGFNVEYDDLKLSHHLSSLSSIGGPNGVKELGMPAIILPAKSEMIEVARRIDFHKDNLFLALSQSGDVTTTVRKYLHCANDGNTDSGKTSNWRGQMVQFLVSGIGCILLNPNFALVNEDGDDWKPIAKGLERQGDYGLGLPRVTTELQNIGYVLDYMANTEVDRRFALMKQGCFDYEPLYLFIDEWPEIALKCKGANDNLGTLLRRGRAVKLCVSVNSQGFLKEDTDLKGSARENFATAFFLGGSTYSGAKLLDISQKELEDLMKACNEPIGKGVAVLRNNACMPNAEVVRLPYADNDFLYHMLGRDDSYRLPPETVIEASSNSPVNNDLDMVYEACIRLKEEGKKVRVDTVTDVVPFGRTKVSQLMKELAKQGVEIR